MGKPKIRFKGYADDWEQRKLGDVCSRVQGNDVKNGSAYINNICWQRVDETRVG